MRENYLKSFMTLILLLCVNIVNAQFDCAVGTNNGKEGHDAFLQGGIYYKPRVTDEEWEYIDEDRTDTRITKHICYIAAVGVSDDVTHVYIPDSIYVNNKYVKVHGTEYSLDYRFEGNKNITSVHFAEGVDYTHVYSFRGCSNLRELTIPSTLRTNTQSFSGTAIEKLTLNWAVSELNGLNIYPTDLLKELILGDKVTAIADNGFRGSSLRSVVIGKNVKKIGVNAFRGCDELTTIVIPSSVTEIGEYAFEGCTKLETVIIGNNVKTIGNSAFRNCKMLKKIVIPNSVTNLGESVFEGCESLASVSIGAGVKVLSKNIFNGCNELLSVDWGANVEIINVGAFYNCGKLQTINLPISTKKIYAEAFLGCSNIRNLSIAGVDSIGRRAFKDCKAITNVTIPECMRYMPYDVFEGCNSIKEVTIKSKATGNSFSGLISVEKVTLSDNVETISLGEFI